MPALSTYLENAVINATLRNVAYTSPATVYLALYTANPTAADTGTEVSGGTYARQSISFTAASAGATGSAADVNFNSMPSCTVSHLGVRDALTAGNLLYFGPLTSAKVVGAGDTFTVQAGNLTLSLS